MVSAPKSLESEPIGAVSKAQVAIISNEPTPYRLHVLNRLADEMSDVKIHNIFTHTISDPSRPWQMELGSQLNVVFFAECHLIFHKKSVLRALRLFRAIRDYIIKNKIKLIVLLGYNDLARLMLIRWAKRVGIPLLLTGDSNIFAEGRVSAGRFLIKRFYLRYILDRLAGLMPMGTCGRAFFRLYKFHHLPEFLFPYEPDYAALTRSRPQELKAFSQKQGWTSDRHRLLYCGRMVSVKRVDVLIDAYARIAERCPEWDLVLAGDGELRRQLEQRIPAALRQRVQWLGFLQFDETILAYQGCDVLVHPSEYEPWGLVINEAVACGLAVISTSVVGAAVELVRHGINGLLVSPDSVDALSDAMLKMTTDGTWLGMKSQAGQVLEMWRRTADPVQGLRDAIEYFKIHPNSMIRGSGSLNK